MILRVWSSDAISGLAPATISVKNQWYVFVNLGGSCSGLLRSFRMVESVVRKSAGQVFRISRVLDARDTLTFGFFLWNCSTTQYLSFPAFSIMSRIPAMYAFLRMDKAAVNVKWTLLNPVINVTS